MASSIGKQISQSCKNSSGKNSAEGGVQTERNPFSLAAFGKAAVPLFTNEGDGHQVFPQPWVKALVDELLKASVHRDIRIALLWPGTLRPIGILHPLATLERLAIGDKLGLRSLLYPAKATSPTPLRQYLLGSNRLRELVNDYCTIHTVPGAKVPVRDNQDFDFLIFQLLSDTAGVRSPSIAELFPYFFFDLDTNQWQTYRGKLLSRSRTDFRRMHRAELKDNPHLVSLETPETAAHGLFLMPHRASLRQFKSALSNAVLHNSAIPLETIICDATVAMQRLNEGAVRRIPEFVHFASSLFPERLGVLVVTDDPIIFFSLRKRLRRDESGMSYRVRSRELAIEGDNEGLHTRPYRDNYVPDTRSKKKITVHIIDRTAAEEASRLWNIATHYDQESEAYKACVKATSFLLSIARLPGGYKDLMAWLEERELPDARYSQMTWAGHAARLGLLIESGTFGEHAEAVRRTIEKIGSLIEVYDEATPMARYMAKRVASIAKRTTRGIRLILSGRLQMRIAQRFLARYSDYPDDLSFTDFEDRLYCTSDVGLESLSHQSDGQERVVSIGLWPSVLKFLLTAETLAKESVVLVDYQRAVNVRETLSRLRSIEALRPYHPRIVDLANELQQRIREIPKPVNLDPLKTAPLGFSFDSDESIHDGSDDSSSWRIWIDDGRPVSVGRRVYIYAPDELEQFRGIQVEELRPGDAIFVMSPRLHDLIEEKLRQTKIPIGVEMTMAQLLRQYHDHVRESVARLFPATQRIDQVRSILTRMREIDAASEKCSEHMVKYWIDLGESSEVTDQELRPHAARSHRFFRVFTQALEISPELADLYWQATLRQRGDKIKLGRTLNDIYTHILFQSEDAQIRFGLSPQTLREMLDEALQSVYLVREVIPPEKKESEPGEKT